MAAFDFQCQRRVLVKRDERETELRSSMYRRRRDGAGGEIAIEMVWTLESPVL